MVMCPLGRFVLRRYPLSQYVERNVRNGQIDHQYAIMVTMTPDATEHGTRDTGHSLRPASPSQAPTGVPYPANFWQEDTGHGTFSHEQGNTPGVPLVARNTSGPDPRDVPSIARNTTTSDPRDTTESVPRNSAAVPRDNTAVPQDSERNTTTVSRWTFRGLLDGTRDALQRRQDSVRSTEDARRGMQQQAKRDDQLARDTVSRESTRKRRAGRQADTTDDIAPIPAQLKVAQVWAERIGGTILKLAPLVASGHFTYEVALDAPLNMDKFFALFLVGGLEGSVWYLNRLREKFKLENDSTASIGLAIFGIIGLIAALIGGHAIWKSAGQVAIMVGLPGTDQQVPIAELVPAIAIGLMSAIGAFIWAKEATYKHRAKLRALNLIDPAAPRISTGAWAFTWWESIWSLRHAFKYRITESPTDDWRHWKAAGKPRIWPIPAGFRWEDKRLVPIPMQELRDMAERDTLLATITGQAEQDAGRQDAGQRQARDAGQRDSLSAPRDTRAITGQRDTERPALTAGPRNTGGAEHGTPDHGTSSASSTEHGTRDTGQHGSRDSLAIAGAHGTADSDRGTAGPDGHGTWDTDGSRNTDGTGSRDNQVDIDAKLLKKADLAMIVMGELDGKDGRPNWETMTTLPSVRAINGLIDAYRKRTEGPEAKFNSNGIAATVQTLLTRMRENPALIEIVRLQADLGNPNNL
jgi:hypothetical protein